MINHRYNSKPQLAKRDGKLKEMQNQLHIMANTEVLIQSVIYSATALLNTVIPDICDVYHNFTY